MFVACNTLCFSKEPLEKAIRHIADLEFRKIDLAIVEGGTHLQPSEIAENVDAAHGRLRDAPSMTPSAYGVDFGDADEATVRKRFEAICRLAKLQTVAVITIPASPLGTPFDDEVKRLAALAGHAMRQGLVLALMTDSTTLTSDPGQAAELCRAVPGLGLTLDPSHYIQGPLAGGNYDEVFPFVQNVLLRDTGRKPGEFQVRVGQGEIEYGRIVNLLERNGYVRALTVSILDSFDNPFEVEVEVRKLKLLLESLI
ncbi:sugar phosphate isomerase/epimerase family protein [Tundrisphaera lichenicola]|uniref:sugar phosphate isomerase/epimerase family protein n=1 Tax=Tundrisphaera lichenicola TaxID=2029860 RepID=UPI003EB83D8C